MDQLGFGAELIRQLPVAAVMYAIVVIFLRSLDKRDENFRLLFKEMSETQSSSRQQMAAHFQNVVDRNNVVIEHVAGVITQCQNRISQSDLGQERRERKD